jgi:MFS family permease
LIPEIILYTKYCVHRPSDAPALARSLGLDRNVAVLGASLFILGLGEELWQAYLPKQLAALGASGLVVGLFASTKDLLDALYQIPGGWMNDHLGRKRALTIFTSVATAGYAVYALASHWAWMFAGLLMVMAWKSGAFPTTFAVIGDALPRGRRATAFGVQSVLVRLPRVIGAPLGGLLIAAFGLVGGVRAGCAIAVALGLCVLAVQRLAFREVTPPAPREAATRIVLAAPLRRLLLADILVRIGEGIAAAFIVLYVTGPLGRSALTYGGLYALQQSVAMISYLPSGKLADRSGRRPWVALTFAFFALFPLAVRFADSLATLVLAFVVGGLKEIGEPARKSLILDGSDPERRGRTVGLYYTIRNLTVVPAGILGGVLWQISPSWPLVTACAVGSIGVVVFLATSRGGPGDEIGHA